MASGINEHKEGCRKQRVLEKAAHARKRMLAGEGIQDDLAAGYMAGRDPEAPAFTYLVNYPPGITGHPYLSQKFDQTNELIDGEGIHGPTATDRLRRQGLRAHQLVTYSAKLPNRLSAVNYTQQW